MRDKDVRETGEMAYAMADLARRCIGPEGTIFRVTEDDAPLLRTSFIGKLAQAAMNILDEKEVQA